MKIINIIKKLLGIKIKVTPLMSGARFAYSAINFSEKNLASDLEELEHICIDFSSIEKNILHMEFALARIAMHLQALPNLISCKETIKKTRDGTFMYFIKNYEEDAENLLNTIHNYEEIWHVHMKKFMSEKIPELSPMDAIAVGFLERIKLYNPAIWEGLLFELPCDGQKYLSPTAIQGISYLLMKFVFWKSFLDICKISGE